MNDEFLDVDEMNRIYLEIMRGVPKEESRYANTDEAHSAFWDRAVIEYANMPEGVTWWPLHD